MANELEFKAGVLYANNKPVVDEAVFEIGGDHKLSWVKYPNGWMEYTGIVEIPKHAKGAYGKAPIVHYPIPFVGNDPFVIWSILKAHAGHQHYPGTALANGIWVDNGSSTKPLENFQILTYGYVTALAAPIIIHFTAKGRWK